LKHLRAGASALIVVAACAVLAAGASSAPGLTVVAKNLNNPRGVFAAPNGSIYIAEAGKAGPTCLDKKKENCVGFSGSIARYQSGKITRVANGLLSVGGQDGSFTAGADGVAVDPSGTAYAVMTAPPECQPVKGLPAPAVAQLGKVLRLSGAKATGVAAVSTLECRDNPDGADRNSNPYALLSLGRNHQVVVDAGANAVLDVRGSKVKLLAVLPKNSYGGQSVPTSIALGPDGAYYVGEFGGEPPKGKKAKRYAARVFRVVPGQKPVVHATGFNAITGLAFDDEGNLYVTEFSIDPLDENNAKGDVVRLGTDGARKRMGNGRLFFPAGAAIGRDGALYVSNWSILPGTAAKAGPFKGQTGQLVRITF
jgi:sugar lactone lactonase YvrE